MTVIEVLKHPVKFLAVVRDTLSFKAGRVGMRFERELELERRSRKLEVENRCLFVTNAALRTRVRAWEAYIRRWEEGRGESMLPSVEEDAG
jgi:transposase